MDYPSWPAGVPYKPSRQGWGIPQTFSPPIKTENNAGGLRQRRRYTIDVSNMPLTIAMKSSEWITLQRFFADDLESATSRFQMLVFDGNEYVERTCQIKDAAVDVKHYAFEMVQVSFSLMIEGLYQ